MKPFPMLARRTWGLVLAVALLPACGGGGGSGGGSKAPETPAQVASQRLEGAWQLVVFQPSLELEAPLKGLLDAQLSALLISFSDGKFTATGPSVDTNGRYEISDASGDTLTGRVFDHGGAGYGVSGQFVGEQFRFTSTDTPWAGTGVLERTR